MWRRLLVAALVVSAVVLPLTSACAQSSSDARGIAVLDADSGKVRWTRAAPAGATFQAGKAGDDLVVVTARICKEFEDEGDPEPMVQAYDERRGAQRWRAVAGGVLASPRWSQPASPVDVGGSGVVVLIGVGPGTRARGVGVPSGAPKWSGEAASSVIGVSDDLVFWGTGGSSPMRATSRRSGREVFEFPRAPDPAWTSRFEVVAADERNVLVANGSFTGRSGSDPLGPTTFFLLDARSGTELGRFPSADPRLLFSGVAMGHGVFVYSERGDVVARSLDDGSEVWRRSFTEQRPLIPTSNRDVVVVATDGGGLEALDLETGKVRWTSTDALVRAADDDTLLVIGISGIDRRIRAVDLASGRLRWSRNLPAAMPGNVSQVAFAVRDDTVVLTDACDLG